MVRLTGSRATALQQPEQQLYGKHKNSLTVNRATATRRTHRHSNRAVGSAAAGGEHNSCLMANRNPNSPSSRTLRREAMRLCTPRSAMLHDAGTYISPPFLTHRAPSAMTNLLLPCPRFLIEPSLTTPSPICLPPSPPAQGTIPTNIFSFLGTLTSMEASNNRLNGTIPESIG